jgi:hypothetical protein
MTVYAKTTWVASTAPGISATALNNLETQYDDAMTQYSTYVPIAASTTPTVGSTTHWARGDHVHNIPNLFQKTTASNTLRLSNDTEIVVASTAGAVEKTLLIPPHIVLGSSIRVKFEGYSTSDGTVSFSGAVVSTGVQMTATATYSTYSYDLTYVAFGTINLNLMSPFNTWYTHIRNFRVYAETTPAFPATSWA